MNYYDILNISPSANSLTIKRAYKKLAVKWHPDKNIDNTKEAETKFKEISQAYQILSDPAKRQNYDINGETPTTFKSPEELFSQLFSNFDPVVSNFLTNTLTKITKSFIEDKNKSVWDVVNEINREDIIEGGSNVVKQMLMKNFAKKKTNITDNTKIHLLKLSINDIDPDAENEIGIDIKFAREFTHINLEITNETITKQYLLNLDYIEHIIRYNNNKYTFLLIDKFPPCYERFNNHNLILKYDLSVEYFNEEGFKFYYPYTSTDYLECNISFMYKSNIVKISNKGLFNNQSGYNGDLFILFNIILPEHSIKEDNIVLNTGLNYYYSMDPLLLINNIKTI